MSGSGKLFIVPPDQIEETWPHMLPHLERFVKETQTTTIDVIRTKVHDLEAQLWGYSVDGDVTGVGVTEVYEHHHGRVCRLWVIVGDLGPVLKPIMGVVERWARDMGCTAIELNGRRGWVRVLDGYKPKAWVIEKDLRTVH